MILNSLINSKSWYIVLITIVYSAFSCESKEENGNINQNSLPCVLPFLNHLKILNEQKTSLDSLIHSERPKLLIYINANCSLCVSELEGWENFFLAKKLIGRIDILFIAESDNPNMLDYIIEDEMDFLLPVAIDDSSNFFRETKNLNFRKDILLFLDKNNDVVFKGDMRKDPELLRDVINLLERK